MGLPKVNRLHRRDFSGIYQRGITRHSPHLKLRAIPPGHLRLKGSKPKEQDIPLNSPQFGISIGRKVSKKAVIRNRLKRQIRAALLELLPAISRGWKMVVVVKPKAIECQYEHFLRELKQLLTQAEAMDGY